MAEIIPKIALLSTGDEIINGSVLNTNSQRMAQQLFDTDIQPGLHLSAGDNQTEIEDAIRFLLSGHAALIITGGLGPTSDDRTRFALGEVLNTRLVFNETCWQSVVQRLQRFGLAIPETNRQQCLFPPEAIVFPNSNGTAAAYQVAHQHQIIFMLPGPPFECMPIFEEHVLPYLKANGYARPLFRCEWLLLNVSESHIASLLDPLAVHSECYVGYRINHPYLEIKLQSANSAALEKMREQFAKIIGPQSVSENKQKASEQLKKYIQETHCLLQIDDRVSGGLLSTVLLDPATAPYLHFHLTHKPNAIKVSLSGLDSYWQNQAESKTSLNLEVDAGQKSQRLTLTIPFRKERTLLYAVEMACWEILKVIRPSRPWLSL